MSDSPFIHQVKNCADKIGLNETMRNIAVTVWLAIEDFTSQYSDIPSQIENLNVASVARFIGTRSKKNLDVESLLLELTCVRLVLLDAGFSRNELVQISVRVKRERLGNDKSGKYRFAKKLCA
jgi:hypothetical protein